MRGHLEKQLLRLQGPHGLCQIEPDRNRRLLEHEVTERCLVQVTTRALDQPVRADAVLIGEVGLNGELRTVGQMMARLREAEKLGFKAAIVPRHLRKGEPWPKGIEIVEARSLREALKLGLVKSN